MARLEIRLLGPPAVLLDGRALVFSRRKTEALLYYLAGRSSETAASSIAGLLWSEYPPERSRASLRRALCDSAAVAGRRILERKGRRLGFASDLEVDRDAARFAALASKGLAEGDEESLLGAAALYRGEYLEGFYLDDALFFEDWQLLEAANFRDRATEVLARLALLRMEAGRLDEAEDWASRLAEAAPLCASGHRLLMELAAARGDAPEALRRYDVYARLLERELGAKPDPSVEELRLRLASGRTAGEARRARPAGGVAAAEGPLPALRDAEMGRWLMDGTASVPGFAAARSYFSSALEREPGKAEALLGLAVCDFGRIFLGVEPPSAFPSVLDTIRRGRSLDAEHPGLLAFEAFLRCVALWEWEEPSALFERAWKARPGDAGVANWYSNFLSALGRHEEALEVAEAAAAASPGSCVAAFSRALRYHYLGRNREALASCERLIARKPDFWLAHLAKGFCELALEAPERAAGSFARAVPEGGFQPRIYRSCALALLGKREEARAELAELGKRGSRASPFLLGLALGYLGEADESRKKVELALEERDFWVPFTHSLPVWRSLPPGPAYPDIAARLGLKGSSPGAARLPRAAPSRPSAPTSGPSAADGPGSAGAPPSKGPRRA